MGMNYHTYAGNSCSHCGRGDEEVHLGKSSVGWDFSLHLHPEFYADWESMKQWLKGRTIKNEHEAVYTHEQFVEMVERKQKERPFAHKNDQYGHYVGDFYFMECDFS